MNGINKAIILGHVGKDPQISNFQNGGKVANFTIATTEKGYTSKNGQQIPDRTEWHNIVCYGALAGVVEKYVKKGTPLYVEGKIRNRSYEKDGTKHYVTEINVETLQMLGGTKSDRQNNTQQAAGGATDQSNAPFPPYQGDANDRITF